MVMSPERLAVALMAPTSLAACSTLVESCAVEVAHGSTRQETPIPAAEMSSIRMQFVEREPETIRVRLTRDIDFDGSAFCEDNREEIESAYDGLLLSCLSFKYTAPNFDGSIIDLAIHVEPNFRKQDGNIIDTIQPELIGLSCLSEPPFGLAIVKRIQFLSGTYYIIIDFKCEMESSR